MGKGVYPLTPVTRTWELSKKTRQEVSRKGFFAIPDFASTAHMAQGISLKALYADLVCSDEAEAPSDELHVAGYVILSRATDLARLWLLHAFPKELFTRGPPTGPGVLLRKLRGEIALEAVDEEFERADVKKAKQAPSADPMKQLFFCAQCLLAGQKPFLKPPVAFGAHSPADIKDRILCHGAWTRCIGCSEAAATLRRTAPTASPALARPKGGASLCCAACQRDLPLA